MRPDPKPAAGPAGDRDVLPFVVLDIDGVLADVRHRLHHLAQRPKDWDAFFAAAEHDAVLDAGADFARVASQTHQLVYLTGRPDRLRAHTQDWLHRHELPPGRLLMRRDGDRRPAATVKVHELRRLNAAGHVDLLVDDDPAVIAAATDAGFVARLADWMPEPTRGATSTQESLDIEILHRAQERDGRT